MAEHHFDTLIRNMAALRSRRLLVQGLMATATTALALRLGVVTTAGQVVTEDTGETCSQDSDCLEAEADPCTGAYCDTGSCTYTSVRCVHGYVCCRNGECCPDASGTAGSVVSDGEAPANEADIGKSDCGAAHPTE